MDLSAKGGICTKHRKIKLLETPYLSGFQRIFAVEKRLKVRVAQLWRTNMIDKVIPEWGVDENGWEKRYVNVKREDLRYLRVSICLVDADNHLVDGKDMTVSTPMMPGLNTIELTAWWKMKMMLQGMIMTSMRRVPELMPYYPVIPYGRSLQGRDGEAPSKTPVWGEAAL